MLQRIFVTLEEIRLRLQRIFVTLEGICLTLQRIFVTFEEIVLRLQQILLSFEGFLLPLQSIFMTLEEILLSLQRVLLVLEGNFLAFERNSDTPRLPRRWFEGRGERRASGSCDIAFGQKTRRALDSTPSFLISMRPFSLPSQRLRFVGLFALAALTSCSSADADSAHAAPGPHDDSPAQGAAGIVYEGETPLTLAPGEHAALHFLVSPPGHHAVRFGLRGDSGDASLDNDSTTTSPDGRVSVHLVAPSSNRTFTVRATLDGGLGAEVPVSVSGLGFGDIEVVPLYEGKRTTSRWTGTVATGTSCAELVGTPPPDGPLISHTVAPRHPIVRAAPVGPALVVTARSGFFAGGCVDIKGLKPFETKVVSVPILDRPLDLSGATLSIELGFDDESSDLERYFRGTVRAIVGAFAPDSDANSLLDAMAESLPAELSAGFERRREEEGWEERVSSYFKDRELSLAGLVEQLFDAALESLDIEGGLRGSLQSGESPKEKAALHPTSFLGVPAELAILPPEAEMSFTAAPLDTVQLGGELSFSPTALLSRAALEALRESEPELLSVGEALADLVSCEELVAELDDESPTGCDASCLLRACTDALDSIWERATSSHESLATLDLGVSGEASVGNEAEIIAFDGSFLGTLTEGETEISVKGEARGR